MLLPNAGNLYLARQPSQGHLSPVRACTGGVTPKVAPVIASGFLVIQPWWLIITQQSGSYLRYRGATEPVMSLFVTANRQSALQEQEDAIWTWGGDVLTLLTSCSATS